MKSEFSYDVLKDKYSKRVGNYKGRDVIVRSKYDDLGNNVYILYDYNNALIVDGYWIANISENGALERNEEPIRWVPRERVAEGESSAPPQGNVNEVDLSGADIDKVLYNAMKAPINVQSLSTGYANADELLKSAYDAEGLYPSTPPLG